ncbi:hypothetical protein HG530_008073 [Fusarium avenaceum]|nr:hypothetical protein HG530_008073 [Fusarium avenaceum]
MHTSTFVSSSLLALAATAQSLKFTGPSTSKVLDLSTEIIITWIEGNSSEHKKWPTFDLSWDSKPTDLKSYGVEFATGLNSSDGQYKFTPSDKAFDYLKPYADELSQNKSFWFTATLRNDSEADNIGPEVFSGKYSVIGLQKTTNAATTVGFGWGSLACEIAAMSFIIV